MDWATLKYSVQARWPALTEADLNLSKGTYEELYERIAARTGESVGEIEGELHKIPGFEPKPDWNVTRANLHKKWPTLTENDLATDLHSVLVARIKNRTWEPVDVIEKAILEATPEIPVAKATRPGSKEAKESKEWEATKAKLKKKWPTLTEADLVEGPHAELVARIQKRTGETKETVEAALRS